MKKIYFAGSITAGREDSNFYKQIINYLNDKHIVLTEHIGNTLMSEQGEAELSREYIYTRDTNWIKECDILVADVTKPSIGVGYEIGFAESLNKPVYCLFREVRGKRLSAMISGNKYVKVIKYKTVKELKEFLYSL